MKSIGFVGPTNILLSSNADVERTINFYLEAVQPGVPAKGSPILLQRGGLDIFGTVPAAEVRASFFQDGRAFVVIDDTFYELDDAGVLTAEGTLATDANPATICSNGTAGGQLFVTSGGNGYIFDLNTNTFAIIADADFPNGTALMGEFMDGYFIVAIADSRRFQISALEDGTDWDPLDVFERSEGSDNIAAIIRNHRELWVLGTKTTEVWYDSGDADTPFQPIQGVFVEQGCAAGFTAVRINNTIAWIGIDERGDGVVWMANGYTPERISTHWMEARLQVPNTNTAAALRVRMYAIEWIGHLFLLVILPADDQNPSPVYDLTTQRWVEWGHWDPEACVWRPFVGQNHMFAFFQHLLGARNSGAVYALRATLNTDTLEAV